MASLIEIMQLCRLCLVKDQVNIPIFEEQGDVRQIFLKLAACFPTVQVSRDDNLPKKICESCMFKLEHSYQFWSLTTNAEKQLNVWLKQIGLDANSKVVGQQSLQMVAQSHAHPHSLETETVILKQEAIDPIDVRPDIGVSSDTQSYILQQQQLPYQPVGFQYEQPPAFSQPSTSSNTGPSATVTSATNEPAMLGKRKRRQVITNPIPSSEESDDDEDIQPPKIAKEEEDSDSADDNEPLQPTAFVSVPAISQDAEQPGPSGLNKPTAGSTSEAPYCVTNLLNFNMTIKKRNKKSGKPIEWKCGKCAEIFDTESKLRKHRKEVHPPIKLEETNKYEQVNGQYLCITCDNEFETLDEVKKHVEEHETQYKCQTCNLSFKEPYKLALHARAHNPEGMLYCPLCDYKTLRLTSMSTHIQHHENNYRFRCAKCGQGFNNSLSYKEHNNFHTGEKPFYCEVCGKNFMYSAYLLSHQLRNHNVRVDEVEGYECTVCSKQFPKATNLKKHMNSHNKKKIKNLLCDFCGIGFSTKQKLTIHRRVHTGEKPFSCQYCMKSFTKRDYLIMHERVHTGEKPYWCEYCGKNFNQAAPLRIHRRNHTGERPYVCHICAAKFISKTALNLHYKTCNV